MTTVPGVILGLALLLANPLSSLGQSPTPPSDAVARVDQATAPVPDDEFGRI